jgi:hypothetical protein
MKKIVKRSVRNTIDGGMTTVVSTGSHCPTNGFWRSERLDSEPLFVFEGSIMPALSGRSTVWHLVQPARG